MEADNRQENSEDRFKIYRKNICDYILKKAKEKSCRSGELISISDLETILKELQ